jgi:hypothetical protein
MRTLTWIVGTAILALTAGCSDAPSGPKADQKSSATANNNYVAGDGKAWKSGDDAGWRDALKQRAQGQDDYIRAKPL